MAIHIKEFNVRAFKGIKNLSLKDLNHINIITGNNNTGKTSILELLYTINDPNKIGCWFFSNHLDSRLNKERFFDYYNNLFPVDEYDDSIYYEYYDDLNCLHKVEVVKELKTKLVSEEVLPENNKSNDDNSTFIFNDSERFVENKTLYFKISKDLSVPTIHKINSIQTGLDFYVPKDVDLSVNYISPVDHSKSFELDDILRDNELHEEMIAILREFDDSIIDVVSVGNVLPSYMIRSKKHSKALPLNFYGDGMRKALLLLSSMLGSKNGILLLDEFETAIHTSAMDHIFSWLLNSAIKLNVQVFLTSHSKEAINKVLRCDESLSDKISYYTLFSYEGKNLVRKLSCSEAIKLQDQGGMDIR